MTDRAADDRLAYQRVLAERDPEVLAAIEGMDAALVGTPRRLDAYTIELLMIVILTTMRGSQERLRLHMRRAMAAGASAQEILEALECIIAPSGLPIFEHGLTAWADVVDAVELQPDAAPFSS
jgi:4-carboxymuconolactone decarboxylase